MPFRNRLLSHLIVFGSNEFVKKEWRPKGRHSFFTAYLFF
jgi:hypothetical protein